MQQSELVKYARGEFKALSEQIREDVKPMGAVTMAMASEYRTSLQSGMTWLLNFEQHTDNSALRNVRQAGCRVIGAYRMINVYFAASEGIEMPESLRKSYEAFTKQLDVVEAQAKELDLAA